jgi:diguanylate cyclase (GGDEF)-like protein/PAS domain S-box-containing protein
LHLIAQIESLEARRQAEANLAAERERLRVTLQAIGDAVVTITPDFRIQYINPAAERLLGIPAEAVFERRIVEVIHLVDPETLRAAPNLIAQSALHALPVRREKPCQLHRADGTVCYVMDAISPITDSSAQITGLVVVLHDVTQEVQRSRELQERATRDPLTGLLNRAEFQLRLRSTFEKSRVLGTPAAVLAIDLDRFKAVNDTGGHAVGDQMLRRVAEVCLLQVRAADCVARLGGDEFAIIVDNCVEERAGLIGRKLLHALNPLVLETQGAVYEIGASIGMAPARGHIGHTEWLAAADAACYRAKKGGRGQLQAAGGAEGGLVAIDEDVTISHK